MSFPKPPDGSCLTDDINSSISAAVSGTERYVVSLAYGSVVVQPTDPPPIPIEEHQGSASSQKVITVSGATAYRVQVKMDRAEVTSLGGTASSGSQIGYVRLA